MEYGHQQRCKTVCAQSFDPNPDDGRFFSTGKCQMCMEIRSERDHNQTVFTGVIDNGTIASSCEAYFADVDPLDCGGAEMYSSGAW